MLAGNVSEDFGIDILDAKAYNDHTDDNISPDGSVCESMEEDRIHLRRSFEKRPSQIFIPNLRKSNKTSSIQNASITSLSTSTKSASKSIPQETVFSRNSRNSNYHSATDLNTKTRVLFKGNYFGEEAIIDEAGSKYTYTAGNKLVTCLCLPSNEFKILLAEKVNIKPCTNIY